MAAQPLVSVALVGATGLTGSHALTQLLANPSVARVYSLARRAPTTPVSDPENKLTWHIEADTSLWPNTLINLLTTPPPPSSSTPTPPPVTSLLSALGTTRGAAGSFAAQRAIDYELNLALAQAARSSIPSITTYVLISSGMASTESRFPYTRMKGELERDIIALGFPKTVIMRPGLIIGGRDHLRLGEFAFQCVERGLRGVFGGRATEWWAQPAPWIARAAGRAAVEEAIWEGNTKERGITEEGGKKLWMMQQAELVRLAKEAGEK